MAKHPSGEPSLKCAQTQPLESLLPNYQRYTHFKGKKKKKGIQVKSHLLEPLPQGLRQLNVGEWLPMAIPCTPELLGAQSCPYCACVRESPLPLGC